MAVSKFLPDVWTLDILSKSFSSGGISMPLHHLSLGCYSLWQPTSLLGIATTVLMTESLYKVWWQGQRESLKSQSCLWRPFQRIDLRRKLSVLSKILLTLPMGGLISCQSGRGQCISKLRITSMCNNVIPQVACCSPLTEVYLLLFYMSFNYKDVNISTLPHILWSSTMAY